LAKVPAGVVAGFKGGTKAELIKFIGDRLDEMAPNAEKITRNMLVEYLPQYTNKEGKLTGKVGNFLRGSSLPAAGKAQLHGAAGGVREIINTFIHESWAHGLYDHIPGMKDIAKELWEYAPKHIKDAMLSMPKYQKMTKAEVMEEFFAYNMGGKGAEMFGLGKSPYYNQMTDETWSKVMNLLTDPKIKVVDPEVKRANFNKVFKTAKEEATILREAYSMDEISKEFREATERIIQQAKGGGTVGARQSKAAVVELLQPRTPQEAVKEVTSQRKRIKEVDMSNYKGEAASVTPVFDPTNKVHLDAMDTWINKTIMDSGIRDPNKIAKLRQSLEKILLNK